MDNKNNRLSVNLEYNETQTIPLALHEMHMARADRRLWWVCLCWAASLLLTVAAFVWLWNRCYPYFGGAEQWQPSGKPKSVRRKMARARARVPESLEDFTRAQWETVIQQAALGVEDTRIAQLYLLDAVLHADIGAEFGLSRSAVSKRLRKMIDKIERTAKKLDMK